MAKSIQGMSQHITLRIPTKEPYAYIEVSTDSGSVQEAYEAYKEITAMVSGSPKTGLERKDFNKALDSLAMGENLPVEAFEGMSEVQKWCYHQVELSIKRVSGMKADEALEYHND